jgi:hypothetical protein
VLIQATELTDVLAVESALLLMNQMGLINGTNVLSNPNTLEIARRLGTRLDASMQALRDSYVVGNTTQLTSSQPDPKPIVPGQYSSPMGATTGSSPNLVPGGKNYKKGLR